MRAYSTFFMLALLFIPTVFAAADLSATELYIKEKIAVFDDDEYRKISRKRLSILEEIKTYKKKLEEFEQGIARNSHLRGIAKDRIERLKKSLKEEEGNLEKIEQRLEEKRDLLKKKLYQRKKKASLQLQKAVSTPEEFKRVKHLILTHPSASEFSGALEWAHRKGIIGEHTSILVLEDQRHFLHSDLKGQLEGQTPYSAHAVSVAGVVYEVAPGARISVYSFDHPEVYDSVDNTIINNSGNAADKPSKKEEELDKNLLLGKNNLLIFSAGNDKKYLKKEGEDDPLDFLFTQIQPSPKNRIIIAGALDPSSRLSSFSNKPGDRKEFQERFLFTLGKNVLVRQGDANYGFEEGTSLAAPAVSGVAALVLGKYEDFSMEEVASVLLESAEKNFYISSADKFVYDPTDAEQKALVEAKYGPKNREYFNPKNYGKGLLSLRQAFIYADIYAELKKEKPHATVEERLLGATPLFKEKIKLLGNLHATNIQKAFRRWQGRKSLREGGISR
jgi:hypothetical protein